MKHQVPHSTFIAKFKADSDVPHPPGIELARLLEVYLRPLFDVVSETDNWRDCGWSINIKSNGKEFKIYFAQFGSENQWLLAIAPLGQPGAIARLLGRKPLPCESELKEISTKVHALLLRTPGISNVCWMFGGPPDKVLNVQSPEQLEW